MGVMRCVGGGRLGSISLPLSSSSRISSASIVILKWHGLAVIIAHIPSINRHVRHREAPACKRVKAQLPPGTAKYRTVATIFHRTGRGVECDASCNANTVSTLSVQQGERARCFLYITCKARYICNARPLFCRILDVPAFTIPLSYHTKDFRGWYGSRHSSHVTSHRSLLKGLSFVISHFR
jgi:hypothetical protein